MDKDSRELLLRDLSARLPYKVRIKIGEHHDYTLTGIVGETVIVSMWEDGVEHKIDISCLEYLKPLLRPISSMAKEEIVKYSDILSDYDVDNLVLALDYLNSTHIDYRNLIEKGLALEAQEGMYKDK